MRPLPVFDGSALMCALDAQRADRELDWPALAAELYEQSSALNAKLADHCLCPGALVRTVKRGTMSCQYALIILRWIRRAPEGFLTGPVAEVGATRLAEVGEATRLCWEHPQLHAAVNDRRLEHEPTWAQLAQEKR